jgi:hypothetical protein
MAAAGHEVDYEVGYDDSSESSDPDSGHGTGARRRVPQSRDFTVVEDLLVPTSIIDELGRVKLLGEVDYGAEKAEWFRKRFEETGRKWRGSQTLRQVGSLVAQSKPASRSISTEMNPETALRHLLKSKREMVDRETIKKLVEQIKEKIEGLPYSKFTLDHFLLDAVRSHKMKITEYLIDAGVNSKDQLEHAFRIAAIYGHLDIMRYLVDFHGVDPRNQDDSSVVHAAQNGHLDIVRYLVEECGSDPNQGMGGTLIGAARNGHLDIVRYLIEEQGIDPHVQDDGPLSSAAINGYLNIVRYFIEELGTDPHFNRDLLFRIARVNYRRYFNEYLEQFQ